MKQNISLKKPLLILFKGYPGTGKSHLSKQLSEHLGLPLIVRDKFKTLLHKQNYPSTQIGKKSYEMLWAMASKYLETHNGCVCDTSLVQATDVDKIESIKQRYNADVLIIECYCLDDSEHKKRMDQRLLYPAYYAINSYDKYKDFVTLNSEYRDYIFPFPTIQVDTSAQFTIDQFGGFIQNTMSMGLNSVLKYNF